MFVVRIKLLLINFILSPIGHKQKNGNSSNGVETKISRKWVVSGAVGECCRVAPRVATELQGGSQIYITILMYLHQFRTILVTAVQESYWGSLNTNCPQQASCWEHVGV